MNRVLMLGLTGAVAFALLYVSSSEVEGWYDNNWAYRRQIQIDQDFVENENFTNFPVLIQVALSDDNTIDNGDDILFTDSTGDVKIPHEIENYDSENLTAWVMVPTLYDNENTTIYVYYGNASATNQENAENVWDDNYVGVWHFSEPSGALGDSTSNANDGSNVGAILGRDGKIDLGFETDDVADHINVPHAAELSITGNITLDAWIYYSAGTYIMPISKNYQREYDYYYTANQLRWYRNSALTSIAFTLSTSTWFKLTVVDDGASVTFYEDGENVGSGTSRAGSGDTDNVYFGTQVGFNGAMDGLLDEIRISNIARSAGWAYTSFRIENDSPGAITLGAEEENVAPTISVALATADNGLIDRNQDVAGSQAVLATQISVQVTSVLGENRDSLTDNVHMWAYDADGTLAIQNVSPIDNTAINENILEYHFAPYDPWGGHADSDMGWFRVYVEAEDNNGNFDNSNNENCFIVDDAPQVTSLNQENLPTHRHRIYGTAVRASGFSASLDTAVRVDNNEGSANAAFSDNEFENTYAVSSAGNVYFQLEMNSVLDGITSTVGFDYAFPNIPIEVGSITVDNALIDRDRDDSASTVELSTIITATIFDLDGAADIIDAWIAVRDNEDILIDNENVFSTATVVDDNTLSFTFTVNPADNLPDNSLGLWDVSVWTAENLGQTSNDWGTTTQEENFEDLNGWTYTETGLVSRVDHELNSIQVKEGTYSHRIWTDSTGGDISIGNYKRNAPLDLTGVKDILFWTQRITEASTGSAIFFQISSDNVSFSTLWTVTNVAENVTEEVEVDVSGYDGEYFLRFVARGSGVGATANFYHDDLRVRTYGENVFKVSDLTSDATFDPASPHYRWNVSASGNITFLDNDNAATCDNIWYIDITESQNIQFNNNDNWQTDNYTINNTLPGNNAQISVVMWYADTLDGIYYENYTVNENWRFQLNMKWEDNFEYMTDNRAENDNLRAEFYFAAYETLRFTINENIELIDLPYEPRFVRIRDLDNNYFRTYRTVDENIDIYMVSEDNIANILFYTVSLDDPTGIWGPPDGYIIFYTFDDGTPVFINDIYWGGTSDTTAYLIFGNIYNIRLGAPGVSDLDWGTFDADANTSRTITPMQITPGDNVAYIPITSSIAWGFIFNVDNDLIITYEDNTENTNWVAIYIYDEDDAEVWFDNNASSSFTAQWTSGSPDEFYLITLNISHELYGSLSSSDIWAGFEISSNLPDDDPFGILGDPPVPWGNLFVAGLLVIVIVSFGPGHAGIGGITVGIIAGMLIAVGITTISVEMVALIIVFGFLVQVYESRSGGAV